MPSDEILLAFDTETTGLPLWGDPSEDPRQPHLVALACLQVTTTTQHGQTLRNEAPVYRIVRPNGWEIPEDMTKIHGISTELAMAEGIPLIDVVGPWIEMMENATRRIAFGAPFDVRIMRIAMIQAGFPKEMASGLLERCPVLDVQRAATTLCNLPPTDKMMAAGRRSPKTPTLTEAIQVLFGETLQDAHNAMADTYGAVRIWDYLEARKPTTLL